MSLLDTLRTNLKDARKLTATVEDAAVKQVTGIHVDLLRTLVSEAESVGKNKGNRLTTDDETVEVITKFLKNARETIGHTTKRITALAGSDTPEMHSLLKTKMQMEIEIEVLSRYMPKQASEEEIRHTISEVGGNIGAVMKALTVRFGKNGFDAQLAKTLIAG